MSLQERFFSAVQHNAENGIQLYNGAVVTSWLVFALSMQVHHSAQNNTNFFSNAHMRKLTFQWWPLPKLFSSRTDHSTTPLFCTSMAERYPLRSRNSQEMLPVDAPEVRRRAVSLIPFVTPSNLRFTIHSQDREQASPCCRSE